MTMNAIVINSSPRKARGNTAAVLNPMIEGMEEAGAAVQTFYPQELDIEPCLGCFTCWTKTPGKCVQRDDMDTILPELAEADIWVLATPLYVDGMTAQMKTLLDRVIPLGLPFIEIEDDHCRHPLREEHRDHTGTVALVSNCGFWERDNFTPLVAHVRAACKNFHCRFGGALLRPHGPALPIMQRQGMPVDDVVAAAKNAGRELVDEGMIAEETEAAVSRELLPREQYIAILNGHFSNELAKLES